MSRYFLLLVLVLFPACGGVPQAALPTNTAAPPTSAPTATAVPPTVTVAMPTQTRAMPTATVLAPTMTAEVPTAEPAAAAVLYKGAVEGRDAQGVPTLGEPTALLLTDYSDFL